ncbi:hypothetical protein REPUB_Repub13aG0127200 [Reevesia pubescens]
MSSKLLKPMEGAENLSTDCLQLIFNHLNDDSLKTVSVACKDFLTYSNLSKQSLKVIHPKISMLSAHLKRFRELKRIDLSDFRGDIDGAILQIAHSGLSLEALDLSCRKAFKIESLTELGSNSKMKNLKVLNFHWTRYSNLHFKTHLVAIANLFPNLQELNIGHYYNYDGMWEDNSPQFPNDYGVEFLGSKLRLLKKISISGVPFSDRSLVSLSSNCVFLKDVTIICCINSGVTENSVGLLLRNRPNLEALSIGHVKMDSSQSTITIENSISHVKALTSLQFIAMDVSDMLLIAIAKAKLRLKKFGLMFCNNFTVAGLLMVLSNYQLNELCIDRASNIVDVDRELLLSGGVGKITHIEISQCHLTNSTFFLLITKCPSLVDIKLYKTALDGQLLDGDNYIPLSKNHKIRNLYLRYCEISDELAKQFGLIFPNLKVLDLSFCYQITSTGIGAVLKSCMYIKKLILRGYSKAKMIEEDNSELPELNLEDLTLSWSLIDDEGLAAIAKKCPKLVSLDLSFCINVTTAAIKQIVKNITTLNCLDMCVSNNINCGDLLEWMLSTGNLASLKKIYVGHNYFTEEQRDEFLNHDCLLLEC